VEFLFSIVEFFVTGVAVELGETSLELLSFRALTSFGDQQPELEIIVEIKINSINALSFITDTTSFVNKNKNLILFKKPGLQSCFQRVELLS